MTLSVLELSLQIKTRSLAATDELRAPKPGSGPGADFDACQLPDDGETRAGPEAASTQGVRLLSSDGRELPGRAELHCSGGGAFGEAASTPDPGGERTWFV